MTRKFSRNSLLRVAAPFIAMLLLVTATPWAQAQTETVLYNFCPNGYNCTDGFGPTSSLTLDGVGNLYGTTWLGGQFGNGTVFELSPNGSGGWSETVLYSFTGGADGANPWGSNVIFDGAGNLYGTTIQGGAYGYGVVFELSPVGTSWTEAVLYSFAGGADGTNPESGLIMDSAGNLYGTTSSTVFELSPSGGAWTMQVIYGRGSLGGLVADGFGNIYGTSSAAVFEFSPNGQGGWSSHVLYTFKKPTYYPVGTLIFDPWGNLYGTTEFGGSRNRGMLYTLKLITKGKKKGQWTFKNLHSFTGKSEDGAYPRGGGLVFDDGADIYGTTSGGGAYGQGTVFVLLTTEAGWFHWYFGPLLWSFNCSNGEEPLGSLTWSNTEFWWGYGTLYGTTYGGGTSCGYEGSRGAGAVFQLAP